MWRLREIVLRMAGTAALALPMALAGAGAPAVAATWAASPSVPGTPGLDVAGNQLLRDGVAYQPHGFNMIALLTPPWCLRPATQGARDHFGQPEMDAALAWHADALRFQVSQRGLADPAIAQADRDAYLATVVAGIALARGNGFAVIVSMQDQSYGCGPAHPLPTAQTLDAWSALAPAVMADPSVAFELFNEPQNQADSAGWAQWQSGGSTPSVNLGDVAVGEQALVDRLRTLGSTNVLIADAARYAEITTGMPRLTDPLRRVAYGIHPYVYTRVPADWDTQYGALAADVPVLATEWNYPASKCGTAAEVLAPDLLTYLRRHAIGVLGHAFDAPGTLIADWMWTPTACNTASGGSGQVLRSFFDSLAGTDLLPPAAPAGVHAVPSATSVALEWTPPPDADVAGYEVVRDGAIVGRPTAPAENDAGLIAGTDHSYTVRAVDAAGNVSANSVPVLVSTLLPVADSTAPTPPGAPTARVVSPTQVTVRWLPSADDVGVAEYRVARDDLVLGTTASPAFADMAATAGTHTYTVTALDAAGNESPGATTSALVPLAAPRGLTGTYFDTATFTAQKLVRIDGTVNFAWGTRRPAATVGPDTFSVRWSGRLLPVADGTYTFYLSSDQGVRLWIDGSPVIDDWTAHLVRESRGTLTLAANRAHDVRIDYYDNTGAASAHLSWSGPGFGKQTVPAAQLLAH